MIDRDDAPPAGVVSARELELLTLEGIGGVLGRILDVLEFESSAELRKSGALRARAEAAVVPVNSATQTKVLLAANGYRRGALVWNDSTATLYVKLGRGATTTDWSAKLGQDDYYEVPAGYVGELTGVWDSANGQARVSEFNH